MSPLIRCEHLPAHEVTALWFAANGWVRNSSALPVNVYALSTAKREASAEAFERLFARNEWPPQWRCGIYGFHHPWRAEWAGRRSPGGPLRHPSRGYRALPSRADLLVVGAYPPGQVWDLQRNAISEAHLIPMHTPPLPSSNAVMLSLGSGA